MDEQDNLFSKEITRIAPWLTSEGIDYSRYPVQLLAREITSSCNATFRNACYHAVGAAILNRADAIVLLLGAFELNRDNHERLEIIAAEIRNINNDVMIDYIHRQIFERITASKAQSCINSLIDALSRCNREKAIEKLKLLANNTRFSQRMKKKFNEKLEKLVLKPD